MSRFGTIDAQTKAKILGKPAKRKAAPKVAKVRTLRWSITLDIPCVVVSEANKRDGWRAANKRKHEQSTALFMADWGNPFCIADAGLPVVITWTHIGREMDGDNLQRSFKGLRDALARTLLVDDGDERITWLYSQEQGTPGVRLTIANRVDDPK